MILIKPPNESSVYFQLESNCDNKVVELATEMLVINKPEFAGEKGDDLLI